MTRIVAGTVDHFIYFVAVDSTDFSTREINLTSFTVYYSINGGTSTAMTTPTVNQTDVTNMPGVYELLIDESGMTTLAAGDDTSELCLHITQASMAPVTRVIEIYRPETTAGNTLNTTGSDLNAIPWNASWDAEVQSEADDAIVARGLDHLVNAAVVGADIIDNSIVAKLVSSSATADWDTFDNTTDSLQSIRDKETDLETDTQDIQGRLPSALSGGRIITDVEAVSGSTVAANNIELMYVNVIVTSTVSDVTPEASNFDTALTDVDNFYNNAVLVFTNGSLVGQSQVINAYLNTNGNISFKSNFTSAPSNGDAFMILGKADA